MNDVLMARARTLLERQPGLGASEAMRRVLQDDPALRDRWHRGDLDQVSPAPAAAAEPDHHDPGQLLLQAIAVKVAAGVPRDQAQAEVFSAYPAVVTAHHEGRLIPKTPQVSKVGPPTEIFRAPMAFRATGLEDDDGDQIGGIIREVEIFSTGTWNGTRYDTRAIDELVASFDHLGYRPPVTLGHNAPDDALAYGHVAKLYRRGDKVLADLAGVPPETMRAIREGRILSVSAEIYVGMKRNGRTFPYALRCLSLLGAHPPGVNLRPISESLPKLGV